MIILFWISVILLTFLAWVMIFFPLLRAKNKLSWSSKICFVIFPAVPILLYYLMGDSDQLHQYWSWKAQEKIVQKQMAQLKNPQELIKRLQNHLKQDQNSAQGWYLLGKLYLDQGQYPEAELSLQKAYRLNPQATDTMIALAKANFFKNQGHLDLEILDNLTKVVEAYQNPPVDALNLIAVNFYKEKNYSKALTYWQKALTLVPPDSPDSRTLQDMIRQAQKQEGSYG